MYISYEGGLRKRSWVCPNIGKVLVTFWTEDCGLNRIGDQALRLGQSRAGAESKGIRTAATCPTLYMCYIGAICTKLIRGGGYKAIKKSFLRFNLKTLLCIRSI